MKEKKTVVLVVVLCIVVFALGFITRQSQLKSERRVEQEQRVKKEQRQEEVYQEVVKNMQVVTPENFAKHLEEHPTQFLFVGRKTCPDCQQFIAKMASLDVSHIYYLDVEKKTPALDKLLDSYHISTVPQLLLFKEGKLSSSLAIFKDIKPAEIQAFISQK